MPKPHPNQNQPEHIADIPTFSKYYTNYLQYAEETHTAVTMLKRFNLNHEVLHALRLGTAEFLRHGNITLLADRYNEAFGEHGWVATESLNADMMQRALELYEEDDFEAAEREILAWLDESVIRRCAIDRCGYFDAHHRMRAQQLEHALELTLQERYVGAVPLIYAACSGFSLDVLGVDAFVWNAMLALSDSLVGHKKALPTFIQRFIQKVNETSEEPTKNPSRHGIVHGKTLDYANKTVCMKAWLLFIALTDLHMERLNQADMEAGRLTDEDFSIDHAVAHFLAAGRRLASLPPERRRQG